jgi:hypothetical protein
MFTEIGWWAVSGDGQHDRIGPGSNRAVNITATGPRGAPQAAARDPKGPRDLHNNLLAGNTGTKSLAVHLPPGAPPSEELPLAPADFDYPLPGPSFTFFPRLA